MRSLSLTRPRQQGRDVLYAQRCLRRHGLLPDARDVYDERMYLAINSFKLLHNLPPDGILDPPTWTLLTRRPEPPRRVSNRRQLLIYQAHGLLGVPYIHAAADPRIGFDPLGFLCYCMRTAGFIDSLPDTTLQEFLAQFEQVPTVHPGDVVVYGDRARLHPTHLLVVLNDLMGIGPLHGNAATRSPTVAMQRRAHVQVKSLAYREPLYRVRMRSFTDRKVDD